MMHRRSTSINDHSSRNTFFFSDPNNICLVNTKSLFNIITVLINRPPVKGNILQNGDFESGSLDPWFCNGCSGSLGTPAHSGEAAFKVDARHARFTT